MGGLTAAVQQLEYTFVETRHYWNLRNFDFGENSCFKSLMVLEFLTPLSLHTFSEKGLLEYQLPQRKKSCQTILMIFMVLHIFQWTLEADIVFRQIYVKFIRWIDG